jgi:hypothetical protein
MEKKYICPDCGAALPSKKAKCPYKIERKKRMINKVQDPSFNFFSVCSFSAIASLLLALVMILLNLEDLAFSFRILAIIIGTTGFAVMLNVRQYRRAFFLLIPLIFVIAGFYYYPAL